ncbi:olfactory receptor 2D3-like [Mantella aurantiaca]
MNRRNLTIDTELILLGFSDVLRTSIFLFFLFSMIYIVTIFGNCFIICVVFINARLHTPMYFFLSVLSFVDLCNISSAVPKLLMDLFSGHWTISFAACATQVYVVLLIGAIECLLLAVMAYDRYLAICRPLHYMVLMKWSVCYGLTAFVCIFSFAIVFIPSLAMPLTLCYPNIINHFMCEVLVVIKLACQDTSDNEIVIFAMSFLSLFFPFILILVSYTCIISTVLKIRTTGRSKAFSTCSSHITVVVLYFGTGMVTYLGPSSDVSSSQEKYVSIFYVIISPMLNPLIYSLNNREVKKTFLTTSS